MDLGKTTLFGMLKGRMGWLARRQEVLAQNIANADTPMYKPNDLKPLDFKQYLQGKPNRMPLTTTSPKHFTGTRDAMSPFAAQQSVAPYETAPDGNAVVLEEQMAKIGETQLQHNLSTELYRKHIGMIKIALGKGR